MNANIKTNGDLMDMANAKSNDKLKAKLRASFQDWCKANARTPMNPETVMLWRSEPISPENAGDLIMTAFGI